MMLMAGILRGRTKGMEEGRIFAGLGVIVLLSFCAVYRYISGKRTGREYGYVGKALVAAETVVLSLLWVLLELAFVCMAA